MSRYLIYNFSGELDDISHLFPNERLARIASIIRASGETVDLIDRANIRDLASFGASYLANLGNLSFYDTNAEYAAKLEAEAALLLNTGYDVVFLNLWHGTGFKFSMDLARLLKQGQPSMQIFGIGQKVDWFKEHILTLAHNALDGLITGLGYNAVHAIVRGKDIADCPNTLTLRGGRVLVHDKEIINVDDYPTGIYDAEVYHHIEYKLLLHTLSLSNQACPNNCVFCIRPENYGKVNIRRRTDQVLQEMLESFHRYGIRYFRFEDSTPPEHALSDIARAIIASEMDGQIRFSAFSRIDTNRSEDFPLLRRAGCLALFFGGESLDDGNLLRLQKGITYAGIQDTVRRAHDAGIRTLSNFIVPIPGETAASLETTFARLAECREIFDSVLTLPAGVYPPTAWGKDPARYGILLDDDYLEKFVTYPIKYLFPLRLWPRLPFRYSIMGTPAAEVDPADIIAVHDQFSQRVRNELGFPPIPDYAFLLADYLQQDYVHVTQTLVTMMINRDYAGLAQLLVPGTVAECCH